MIGSSSDVATHDIRIRWTSILPYIVLQWYVMAQFVYEIIIRFFELIDNYYRFLVGLKYVYTT